MTSTPDEAPENAGPLAAGPAAPAAASAGSGPFQTRAGAYALIVAEGRILLSSWEGSGVTVWTLPGGGLELGESAEEACVREVFEETGHDVELTGLLGVTTGQIPAERRLRGEGVPLLTVQILFSARITGGTLRPEVGGSSSDARWFDLAELPALRTARWIASALARAGIRVPGLEDAGPDGAGLQGAVRAPAYGDTA